MSDDIKERVRRIRQSREAPPPSELSATPPKVESEEANIYGIDKSVSRTSVSRWPEVSLRLRFQDGRQRALPYFMLQDIVFDPGSELVLEYVHFRVRLQGRKLAPLFDRLADHKVRYVQEMDELAAEQIPEGETVVTAITIEKL